MIPWWGVALCCIGFAGWSALMIMVGAAISMQANKPKQYRPKGGPVSEMFIAPDDLGDLAP